MSHDVIITGGTGGARAHTEDLDAIAAELQRIGAELGLIFLRTAGHELDPALEVSYAAAPVTAFDVARSGAEFLRSSAGVSARLSATGTALGAAAHGYRMAEEFTARLFEQVLTGMGNILGHVVRTALPVLSPLLVPPVLAAWAIVFVASRTELDEQLEDALGIDVSELTEDMLLALGQELFEGSDGVALVIEHVLPGFVAGFLGVPPGLQATFGDSAPWPHDSQTVTDWVIAGGRAGGYFRRTDVEVKATERPAAQRPARAPAHVPEVFARTRAGHRGRDNGRVQVERIVGPDGTLRWIVYVPATTDWSPVVGENSTDLTTNVEGAAGHDTAMRETVRQAVADAGVRDGEEIMLAGFSQGGITAASLAADPAFREATNVTALLTVGSPVSDFDIPPDVATLSIEHEQDLVPDLDGNQNPDRPHWTTITVDLDYEELHGDPQFAGMSDAEITERLASPGFPHTGDAYAATLDRLHTSGDPALSRWTADNSAFFEGEVAEVRDYTGTRR